MEIVEPQHTPDMTWFVDYWTKNRRRLHKTLTFEQQCLVGEIVEDLYFGPFPNEASWEAEAEAVFMLFELNPSEKNSENINFYTFAQQRGVMNFPKENEWHLVTKRSRGKHNCA